MPNQRFDTSVNLFSTCPASSLVDRGSYPRNVRDVARWSERAGCTGILVYSDNSLVDPWLLAQIIIESTESLCPLVAVQPIYMHPYSVAKMVASFGHLYGRRIYLNMVAGGFKNDLTALNDGTPHDRRYERLVEYTTIIKRLLGTPAGISYQGEFYRVDKLKLTPALPPGLFPGVFVSGSSEGGLAAAKAMGATAVKYPKPPDEEESPADNTIDYGVRVGVIARRGEQEAWAVARARFPEDRKGQLTHQLAMKTSDSQWHKQLSELGKENGENPYWLVPFENYKTMCPYLVGSYGRVAEELARYIALGYRTFILDVPPDQEELQHIRAGFERALEVAHGGIAAALDNDSSRPQS